MIRVDASELRQLAADLDRGARRAGSEVADVVKDTARTIRDDARSRAPSGPHTRHYPSSITGEVTTWGRGARAEIGPDKGLTQGPLGNLLEFGSVNNAPIPHLAPALDAAEPGFLRDLAGAVGDELL